MVLQGIKFQYGGQGKQGSKGWAYLTLALTYCILSVSQQPANAWVQYWTRTSDVVCVAKVTEKNIKPLQTAEQIIPTKNVEFKLSVERTLKGDSPEVLSLQTQQFDRDALNRAHPGGFGFSGPIPFGELEVGHRYLLFLRRGKTEQFILANGYSGSQSVLETQAQLPETLAENQILLNILRLLLATARSPEEKERLRVINLLSDFQNYACDNFISYQREALRQLRLTNGYEELRIAVRDEAIPLLIELTKAPEVALRHEAIFTVGHLQSVAVIPQLVQLIEEQQDEMTKMSAVKALSSYCLIDAGPSLIKLLDLKHKVEVRRAAAHALQTVQDKRTVPILIEILQTEPDIEVGYWVSSALGETLFREQFDVLQGTTREGFPAERLKYQTYWAKWAVEHQALLNKWQAELQQVSNR